VDNVDIFDISGRKLMFHTPTMHPVKAVDISHFPAGIYFVKVSTEVGEIVKKVLKE